MASPAYHHGNLREALVDAAVDAARERGADGLALRDLARRVGVSHNAAYRHFANRDDLVAEVAGRVMDRLVETMQRRWADVDTDDPVLRARRRLAAVGRSYVEFAVGEPGLFSLAFSSVAVSTDLEGAGPYLLLGQALDELVEVGFLSAQARPGAEITCWSAMHGFSVLAVDGAERGASDAEREAALETVLTAIDRSYGATTGTETRAGDLLP
ncbi:TetR/AcrR family transcriptional regulator [Aeromicrobium sp.]|uniref:TetR/AcrR family transcriptional regulator n=1 Tax=Aeromicrobium sp. TaxID=1871063 RepID=UPI004033BF8B